MAAELTEIVVGPPLYTRTETCDATGVPLDEAIALWRAMGFAVVPEDVRVFTERDVSALRTARALRDLGVVDDEGLLALARTMAQAMSRLAHSHATIAASYLGEVGPAEGGAADPALDAALHDAADHLLGEVASLLEYMWRRHLAVFAESAFTPATAAADTAVGFADIVGFTETSRSVAPDELARMVESFERLAAQLVAEAGGRVVKTLGDEVLYVADDVRAAVSVGLDLASRVPGETGREVRVGLAYGPVVARLGDVFGPTVNLASRLTDLARPGSVLLDRGAAAALRDDGAYDVTPLRRHSVRGYSHLAPFRVRRATT